MNCPQCNLTNGHHTRRCQFRGTAKYAYPPFLCGNKCGSSLDFTSVRKCVVCGCAICGMCREKWLRRSRKCSKCNKCES